MPAGATDAAILDREASVGLRPVAWTLAGLYVFFGFMHMVFLRPDLRPIMVALNFGEATVLLAMTLAWRARPPRAGDAHAWMTVLGLLALANSGTLVLLVGRPEQAITLYFLAIGGGFLLLRRLFFLAYCTLVAAVFATGVAIHPSPDWIHYSFGLLSAFALASIVHAVRASSTLRLHRALLDAGENERRLRAVLAGAPIVLFALDKEGRFTLAEGHGLKGAGLQPQDLLGKSVFELYADRPQAPAARQALAGTPSHITVEEYGRLYDVDFTPLQEGGATGVAVDVTDRRQAERAQTKADEQRGEAERLRELDRLRTDFVNAAAHELSTPLTPIRLQLRLLDTVDPAARAKGVAVLRRNVERLNRVVEDLLAVTRIQQGKLDLQFAPFDLAQAAALSVDSFAEPARQGGVELVLEAPDEVPAWGDARRVQQVLDNLVANAVKFTRTGGRVTLSVRAQDGGAAAEVVDSGIGMKGEDVGRLFQPFGQLEAGRERGGTGLGLHLSKAIIETHGGRVYGRSPGIGLGSTFGFWIPAKAGD